MNSITTLNDRKFLTNVSDAQTNFYLERASRLFAEKFVAGEKSQRSWDSLCRYSEQVVQQSFQGWTEECERFRNEIPARARCRVYFSNRFLPVKRAIFLEKRRGHQ